MRADRGWVPGGREGGGRAGTEGTKQEEEPGKSSLSGGERGRKGGRQAVRGCGRVKHWRECEDVLPKMKCNKGDKDYNLDHQECVWGGGGGEGGRARVSQAGGKGTKKGEERVSGRGRGRKEEIKT